MEQIDGYDDLGQVTEWMTWATVDGVSADETQTFTYDAVGRLASAKAVGGPATYDFAYTYQPIGNSNGIGVLPSPAL